MSKIPAFQFYPADWRKDNGVQSLNYFERGVWFEMLCLMHESEQRGKLLLNGRPMPEEALARLLGLDRQVLSKTLTTLLEFGVCSRDESGALVNRRMLKDEVERSANAERQRRFYEKKKPNGQPNGNLTAIQQKSNKPSSTTSTNTFSKQKDISRLGNAEDQEEYLFRKQTEYLKLDVQAVFKRYIEYCRSKHIQPKRPFFDYWLASEYEPMTADFESLENKMTDEIASALLAKKYGGLNA